MKLFWVYILHCQNNSYYTGYTDDLAKRYKAHINGKGSKYTRSFKPLSMAQCWEVNDKSLAMKLEKQIKNLSQMDKVNLIAHPNQLTDGSSIKVGTIPDALSCKTT